MNINHILLILVICFGFMSSVSMAEEKNYTDLVKFLKSRSK